jgi:hypothetical protein
MPAQWTNKGQNAVADLGHIVVRFEALLIAQRLTSVKSMLLMHQPELMETEQGRQTLANISTYLTKIQDTLRPKVSDGK